MFEVYAYFLYDLLMSEVGVLQLSILCGVGLMIWTSRIFYLLLYLGYMIFMLGLCIAFYQMELFTGFLWVAECTIILVFLILFIYLHADGITKIQFAQPFLNWFYLCCGIMWFLIFSFGIDFRITLNFDHCILWDDFYEGLNNVNLNDFNSLFLGYYGVNSFEFIGFAFLLLITTFVCGNLFRCLFINKLLPYSNFFSFFRVKDLLIQYSFLRQQNLHTQTNIDAAIRLIRKK